MKISELIDKVARQVVDINHIRWTREEFLDYFNMGISHLILNRPDVSRATYLSNTSNEKLEMPDDASSIITVNHVNFRAVQYVDVNKLSQVNPDWRNLEGTPRSWTRNEFDFDSVYLYPKPLAPVDVEFVYSRKIRILDEQEEFPIKEIYMTLLFDYMIYRAFAKDSEQPGEAEKAQYHLMLFKDAIGDKAAADSLAEQILQNKEKQR